MSAVSSPLSSPASEPVVPRRRAPEADAGREAVPFSLPQEPAAEARPAQAEDKAKAETKPAEAGATQPAAQQGRAGSTPAGTPPAATKPAGASAPATPSQAAAAEASVTPVVVQPKPDVGALVAIAQAEQAVAGEIGETIAKPKKAEGEGKTETKGDEAKADGADAAAILPAPTPDPAPATLVQPMPILPVGTGATQQPVADGGEGVQSVAPGKASVPVVQGMAGSPVAADAIEMVPVATVPEMPPGVASEAETGEAVTDPAAQADKPPRLAAVTKLPFDLTALGLAGTSTPGGDAPVAKAAGEAKPAEAVHAAHAKAGKGEATEASAATVSNPAEIAKSAEAQQPQPQPVLTANDVSALVHNRAGKPEPMPMPGADSAAAATQQQLGGGQNGAAGGQPTPLHVVPMEIGLRALAGSKRFDIRLDPAELGRIDVKLEISDKGEVSAKLVVDRVETLHLLQRDARTLERAFEQAGLKPSDAGVDITLRDPGDQPGFRQNRQDEQSPRHARTTPETDIDDVAIAAQPVPVRRLVRLGGVDLSI